MKKLISFALCLTLLLGLTACGTQKPNETIGATDSQMQSVPDGQSESSAPTDDGFDLDADGDDILNADDEPEETMNFADYEEDKYHTSAIPEGMQKPVEPGDIEIDKNDAKTCYLTIDCKTILDNMDLLTPGKEGLVPADGIILPRTEVTFYAGESVYDVLLRETRARKIHMESSFTPMYNSAYIEGIHNLYEFDCGSTSGWMYSVNGWFPNYGVSRYVLQQGDELQLRYTCDLGRDVGDIYWESMQ